VADTTRGTRSIVAAPKFGGNEWVQNVESLPRGPPGGGRCNGVPGASCGRTEREFLRPEALLSVNDLAGSVDVTRQTVHNWIAAGKQPLPPVR
jgi:hypothetical protein